MAASICFTHLGSPSPRGRGGQGVRAYLVKLRCLVQMPLLVTILTK